MVKNRRQPKYTFTGEYQHKRRYFHSAEHHEAIRRNEPDPYIIDMNRALRHSVG